MPRDVQLLTAHDHDFAALQQVLGHNGGQTANQVVATIDDDPLRERERRKLGVLISEVMFGHSFTFRFLIIIH